MRAAGERMSVELRLQRTWYAQNLLVTAARLKAEPKPTARVVIMFADEGEDTGERRRQVGARRPASPERKPSAGSNAHVIGPHKRWSSRLALTSRMQGSRSTDLDYHARVHERLETVS